MWKDIFVSLRANQNQSEMRTLFHTLKPDSLNDSENGQPKRNKSKLARQCFGEPNALSTTPVNEDDLIRHKIRWPIYYLQKSLSLLKNSIFVERENEMYA